ncbi:MAG: hypothetical protein ABI885_23095 [Gammaproteobacteria bacterium]
MQPASKLIALLATALSASCVNSAEPVKDNPLTPAATPSRKPEPVPAAEATQPAPPVEAVPADLIEKMRADLSTRSGSDASAARVASSESVTWPSGALGCGKPGEMYTQALVPGYRVQFEMVGRTYTYHAAKQGYFKFCANPTRLPVGAGDTK